MRKLAATGSWSGALALALAMATVSTPGRANAQANDVSFEPCTIPPAEIEARCGRLSVPEDRSDPDGRRIGLSIIVLPALGEDPEPDPIFPLHGGPGAAARYLVPLFASNPLRRTRDFVFVDQRGTGGSNGLQCEPGALEDLMEVVLLFTFPDGCSDFEADVTQYGTSVAMDDLDHVRAALGYDRINLWGGSYGTRAALEFMRRHPERVRTVLLDGVAPAWMYIPLYFPPGAEAALGLVLEDCAADAECGSRFPNTRQVLDRALEGLRAERQTVTVTDPRTQAQVDVSFGPEELAASVLYALYNSGTAAQLPWWIHQAETGNLAPIANFAAAFSVGIGSQFSFGMTAAVACPEDAARYDLEDVVREARNSFLGETLGRSFLDSCEDWPAGRLAPDYWTPVSSDLPVLVLSGQGDPVTPPHWADVALETLGNARHAVFPDNGHGATGSPCGTRLFTEFVEVGSARDLDLSCAARNVRPAWGGLNP